MSENLLYALAVAAGLFWLGYIFRAWRHVDRVRLSPEWQPYKNPWWRRVTLIDGTKKRGGEMMRRVINGQPQYRPRTKDEQEEWDRLTAW